MRNGDEIWADSNVEIINAQSLINAQSPINAHPRDQLKK